jgi:Fe-S-cluster containining protein
VNAPICQSDDDNLARAWLLAARSPTIAGSLEAIYADVAREIEHRGPACWASGRCCNFAKTGHLLYVTGLEAAYTLVRAGEGRAKAGSDAGGRADLRSERQRVHAGRVVTLAQIDAARSRGDCPFLEGNLCGAHAIKPLGCRVYFCDAGAQEWQHELSEQALERIRALHDANGLAYRYGEWRGMLESVAPAAGGEGGESATTIQRYSDT